MHDKVALIRPGAGEGPVALSPVPTAELDRLADGLDRNAIAKNTARNYRSDWTCWLAFCEQHQLEPLPADPAHVRRYISHLVEIGGRNQTRLKPGTAARHLAAIAAAHRASGLAFDTGDPVLRRTLDGIRRTYGTHQAGAKALRTGDIIEICKRLSLDLRSVRDKAIILLGFAGGFRRSEIVALNVSDLTFEQGVLRILLRRSKTDQTG